MRLHKTGHAIADTISDLIGELPDDDYDIAYGILRHEKFSEVRPWFEIDKGFWQASHYEGNYRLSFKATQPKYHITGPNNPHGLTLEPWRNSGYYTLICPPTNHVCEFFKIDLTEWLMKAHRQSIGHTIVRHKSEDRLNWNEVNKIITFNSTIGVEALRLGIPVISDPVHSTIGSYSQYILDNAMELNRDVLFNFMQGHQFKLDEKQKIVDLIRYYLEKHK